MGHRAQCREIQGGGQVTGLAIEYRPIAGLIPYAREARTHSEEQVAHIAGSIREFGFTKLVLLAFRRGVRAKSRCVVGVQMCQSPVTVHPHLPPGTESSNPPSSSGESANPRSLARDPGHFRRGVAGRAARQSPPARIRSTAPLTRPTRRRVCAPRPSAWEPTPTISVAARLRHSANTAYDAAIETFACHTVRYPLFTATT